MCTMLHHKDDAEARFKLGSPHPRGHLSGRLGLPMQVTAHSSQEPVPHSLQSTWAPIFKSDKVAVDAGSGVVASVVVCACHACALHT
jgi:hypothetical protein